MGLYTILNWNKVDDSWLSEKLNVDLTQYDAKHEKQLANITESSNSVFHEIVDTLVHIDDNSIQTQEQLDKYLAGDYPELLEYISGDQKYLTNRKDIFDILQDGQFRVGSIMGKISENVE